MSKIFITGMGAITPIGNDPAAFWDNLRLGVSGADRITTYDASAHPTQISCAVKDFDPADYMERKKVRRLARATQFAVATSKQAIQHAQLEITPDNAHRVGVVMNTGGGGIDLMEDAAQIFAEQGPRSAGPFLVPTIMANAVSCLVSIQTGAAGPVVTSALACASGSYAFIEAYYLLQRGEADVMIAGGTEGSLTPLIMAALGRMHATSIRNDDPQRASRPFDAERDGFVQGEGSVAMILETEKHARARGARCYAEILGGALAGDAYHFTAPHPEGAGAIRAMRGALKNAGLTVEDVDVIYAHGTSTPLNDAAETKVIKAVFGERAYAVPVSGVKSTLGHTMGAAGAMATLAAVQGFVHGWIPPTINQETPDPECDLDYVPNVARQQQTDVALVNAFGFGGQNVVLVLRRVV